MTFVEPVKLVVAMLIFAVCIPLLVALRLALLAIAWVLCQARALFQ